MDDMGGDARRAFHQSRVQIMPPLMGRILDDERSVALWRGQVRYSHLAGLAREMGNEAEALRLQFIAEAYFVAYNQGCW